MAKLKIYRQGDIMLVATSGVEPGDQIPRDGGRVVLAYGEVTGHAHAIAAPQATLHEIQGDLDRLLRCQKQVELRHEEHGTIVLPVGDYLVKRQREYTPEEVRYVAD